MPDERESPSGGWREVYREMNVSTDVEEATARCPDCGRTSQNVARDVYDCEDHGLFRPDEETDDEREDAKNRAAQTAD